VLAGTGAAVLTLAGPAPAQQARRTACPFGSFDETVCSIVTVPLDRTGAVPGSVRLRVEAVTNAAGNADRAKANLAPVATRGTMLLLAGGPGQGSASSFGLDFGVLARIYRQMLPGYDLAAFDGRGTGRSGALDCPGAQRSSAGDLATIRRGVVSCARRLGRGSGLYSTAAHVADIDAVRQSLGVDRISLFAVSYGTQLALNYARAFPQHVDRLILDSVVPAEGSDPFAADILRAIPRKLASWCAAGRCVAATRHFARDVTAVANRAGARPLRGTVRDASGRHRTVRADGATLLSTTIDLDLTDGIAAQAPAAFAAARAGRPAALLRLADTDRRVNNATDVEDLSNGLFYATECVDGPFPWTPPTPPGAARTAAIRAALGRYTRADLGGFGPYAAELGNALICQDWPAPAGGVVPVAGAFPNVPVLAISGGIDMRTPTAGAVAVLRQFPQGRLLVDPGVGHNPTGADLGSRCLSDGIEAFLDGRPARRTVCPRAAPALRPLAAYPARGPRARLGPSATRALALRTVRDAETIGDVAAGAGSGFAVGGLAGGSLRVDEAGDYALRDYALVPGVTISGTISPSILLRPTRFTGTITVGGRFATPQRITL
jgi:pimeloyl-ACP methyl ester carboxylesterase